MSYGSDYRDRQNRSRRREQRLVINAIRSVVTTAALVAIAFAFDVPQKIREKLMPREPEQLAERSESTPRPEQQPGSRGTLHPATENGAASGPDSSGVCR